MAQPDWTTLTFLDHGPIPVQISQVTSFSLILLRGQCKGASCICPHRLPLPRGSMYLWPRRECFKPPLNSTSYYGPVQNLPHQEFSEIKTVLRAKATDIFSGHAGAFLFRHLLFHWSPLSACWLHPGLSLGL